MKTNDILSSDSSGQEILLIGDAEKVLSDANAIGQLPCEVCKNVLEAVDAAKKHNFTAIAVVMSDLSSELGSVLSALKQSNTNAKIVLLAQMHEEPLAMQIVSSASNGESVADDYLICPIRSKKFYECITAKQSHTAVEAAKTVAASRITEAKVKELEKLATTDELTGLKNRRYIWEFSRQIIERAKAQTGYVTLLIFDIDNFKHYNDVYGHPAGDEILREAAVLMHRSCRNHDVVGRIGGDEFAVVFWDDPKSKINSVETERRLLLAEHPTEPLFIAKRFQQELNKAELSSLGPEGKGVLTISGGLASFPRDGSTTQELFEQADKALLEAKRSGKNTIYLVGKPENNINNIK